MSHETATIGKGRLRRWVFDGGGRNGSAAIRPDPDDLLAENTRLRLALGELTRRFEELSAAHERLTKAASEAGRRRDQLMGERAQLERQLAERDRRVQHLCRELGALSREGATGRAGDAPNRFARVVEGLAAIITARGLRRRQRVPDPANPRRGSEALPVPTAAAAGEPPLVPLIRERPGARVILVAVFGLDPAELGRVVELVDSQCATAGVVPVFLTDGDDFEPFRRRRLPFEYLPPPSDGARFAPDLDWNLYRQRRLALLRRKWQPARIVAFGPVAREALAAWRESPFEDGTIDAAIAGGNGSAAAFP